MFISTTTSRFDYEKTGQLGSADVFLVEIMQKRPQLA